MRTRRTETDASARDSTSSAMWGVARAILSLIRAKIGFQIMVRVQISAGVGSRLHTHGIELAAQTLLVGT